MRSDKQNKQINKSIVGYIDSTAKKFSKSANSFGDRAMQNNDKQFSDTEEEFSHNAIMDSDHDITQPHRNFREIVRVTSSQMSKQVPIKDLLQKQPKTHFNSLREDTRRLIQQLEKQTNNNENSKAIYNNQQNMDVVSCSSEDFSFINIKKILKKADEKAEKLIKVQNYQNIMKQRGTDFTKEVDQTNQTHDQNTMNVDLEMGVLADETINSHVRHINEPHQQQKVKEKYLFLKQLYQRLSNSFQGEAEINLQNLTKQHSEMFQEKFDCNLQFYLCLIISAETIRLICRLSDQSMESFETNKTFNVLLIVSLLMALTYSRITKNLKAIKFMILLYQVRLITSIFFIVFEAFDEESFRITKAVIQTMSNTCVLYQIFSLDFSIIITSFSLLGVMMGLFKNFFKGVFFTALNSGHLMIVICYSGAFLFLFKQMFLTRGAINNTLQNKDKITQKEQQQIIKTYLNSLDEGIAVYQDNRISIRNKKFQNLMFKDIKSNISQFHNVFRVWSDIGNSNSLNLLKAQKDYTLEEMIIQDPEFFRTKVFQIVKHGRVLNDYYFIVRVNQFSPGGQTIQIIELPIEFLTPKENNNNSLYTIVQNELNNPNFSLIDQISHLTLFFEGFLAMITKLRNVESLQRSDVIEFSQNLHDIFRGLQKMECKIQAKSMYIAYFLQIVLDFQALESHIFKPLIEIFDIQQAILQIKEMLSIIYLNKKQKIKVKYVNFDNFYVRTDKKRLQQVLINLLQNAIKFTPEFGRIYIQVKNVSKDSFCKYDHVQISIIDTGDGVKISDKKFIMRKFRQKKGIITDIQGSGFGLDICQLLVSQYDGIIDFISKPFIGSTFFFTFRLYEMPQKMLIVGWDQNPSLEKLVQKFEFKPKICSNVQEANLLIESQNYKIIVIEVEQIQYLKQKNGCQIIGIVSNALPRSQIDCADEIFGKPLNEKHIEYIEQKII